MFRDRQQASAVMRALLYMVGLDHLWTPDGPTPQARELLVASGAPLPLSGRTMLLCAWSLWNGEGRVDLRDVVESLDRQHTGTLCLLLLALQDDAAAVDEWLDDYAPRFG